jgi:hypothetical protein
MTELQIIKTTVIPTDDSRKVVLEFSDESLLELTDAQYNTIVDQHPYHAGQVGLLPMGSPPLPISTRQQLAEVLGGLTFLEVWDLRKEGKYRLRDKDTIARAQNRLLGPPAL